MAVKSILTYQTDFTGEFPYVEGMSGLWRFNESEPDADDRLIDSSGNDRKISIINWSGTTASIKTHLKVINDGTIFSELGERMIVGGWSIPRPTR